MADAPLPDLPDVADEFDFREVAATREQKLWMIDLIINRTESAISLITCQEVSFQSRSSEQNGPEEA